MLVNFDAPGEMLVPLMDELHRDLDGVEARVLRREVEVGRPCQEGPCDWGGGGAGWEENESPGKPAQQ